MKRLVLTAVLAAALVVPASAQKRPDPRRFADPSAVIAAEIAFAKLAQEKGQIDRSLTPHQATIGLIALLDGLLFNWTKKPEMFPLASYAPGILDAWFMGLGVAPKK